MRASGITGAGLAAFLMLAAPGRLSAAEVLGCPSLDRSRLEGLLQAELAGMAAVPAITVRCDSDIFVEVRWSGSEARSRTLAPVTNEPLERSVASIAGELARAGPPTLPLPPEEVGAGVEATIEVIDASALWWLGADGWAATNGTETVVFGGGGRVWSARRVRNMELRLGVELEAARRELDEALLRSTGVGGTVLVARGFRLGSRLIVEPALGTTVGWEHIRAEARRPGDVGGTAGLFTAEPFLRTALLGRPGAQRIGAFVEFGVALPTPRAVFESSTGSTTDVDLGPLRARLGLVGAFGLGRAKR